MDPHANLISRFVPPRHQGRSQGITTGALRDGTHLFQPLDAARDKEEVYWQTSIRDEFVHLSGTRSESLDTMEPRNSKASEHDKCRCRGVDFHRILAKGGPEEYLCTLQHALECSACPFCEYIRELTSVLDPRALETKSQDVQCRVKRIIAAADEFPQRMSTSPLARIFLILRDNLVGGPHAVLTTSFTLDQVPYGRPLSTNSDLCSLYRRPVEKTFDPKLLSEWLDKSNRSETSRKQSQSSQQNASFRQLLETGTFRVVDVVHRKIVSVSRPVQFLALSYVWGRSMTNYAAVLSDAREAKDESGWEQSIDWLRLPRTVNDAIDLTKSIGERYLWVDSLCIDQFDAEEKGYLISQMVRLPFASVPLAYPEVGSPLLQSLLNHERSRQLHKIHYVDIKPDEPCCIH